MLRCLVPSPHSHGSFISIASSGRSKRRSRARWERPPLPQPPTLMSSSCRNKVPQRRPEELAMLKQIEGSQAMAEAIALCRPEVICAYPITPQTHIVEGLGELVKEGALENCEYINVESEFAALSVAIGASAAGAPRP